MAWKWFGWCCCCCWDCINVLMALDDVLWDCLLSKVLALLVVRSCARSALLVTFSIGSLEVVWSVVWPT
uniref:Putative secreted protein n=1 Tax=Anopheles triannulatus TaxID=58253 RepID=A0A2M4B2I4_9DIPT